VEHAVKSLHFGPRGHFLRTLPRSPTGYLLAKYREEPFPYQFTEEDLYEHIRQDIQDYKAGRQDVTQSWRGNRICNFGEVGYAMMGKNDLQFWGKPLAKNTQHLSRTRVAHNVCIECSILHDELYKIIDKYALFCYGRRQRGPYYDKS